MIGETFSCCDKKISSKKMEPACLFLPPEVQGEIMKWQPELIRRSQLVSRGLARATTGYYLQQECVNKLVSRNEVLDYLIDVNPINVGGCQVIDISKILHFQTGQLMQSACIKGEMDFSGVVIMGHLAVTYTAEIRVKLAGWTPKDKNDQRVVDDAIVWDLLTVYYTYQRRLDCQRRDRHVAGESVRHYFNYLVTEGYWQWLLPPTDQQEFPAAFYPILARCYLYLYLVITAVAIDVQPMQGDWPSISFPETDDAATVADKKRLLEAQINYLINSIQQIIANW